MIASRTIVSRLFQQSGKYCFNEQDNINYGSLYLINDFKFKLHVWSFLVSISYYFSAYYYKIENREKVVLN